MINSINWIDGLDGLSSGVAIIAAVTLGLISLSTRVNQPLIAVLCFILAGSLLGFLRWNFHPARIFTGTSGVHVRRLHAGRAVDPRHGQGRGGAPGPRRPDHRHVLDHRPAHLAASIAVHARPAAHPPPPAGPGPVTPPDGAGDLRRCARRWPCSRWSSPARRCCTRSSCVFIAAGLVLFLPTRGDFGRPDELEAEAYEPAPTVASEPQQGAFGRVAEPPAAAKDAGPRSRPSPNPPWPRHLNPNGRPRSRADDLRAVPSARRGADPPSEFHARCRQGDPWALSRPNCRPSKRLREADSHA